MARGHEKVQSSLQALDAKLGTQMGKHLNDKATRHVPEDDRKDTPPTEQPRPLHRHSEAYFT